MLGIAYEHDASFAARCPKEQRDDSVIGPGLPSSSPQAASVRKSRTLLSRTRPYELTEVSARAHLFWSRLQMQTPPYSTRGQRTPSP